MSLGIKAARKAAEVAVRANKGLAKSARWSAGQIAEHREEIAARTAAVVRATGAVIEGAGRAVVEGARTASAGTANPTGRAVGGLVRGMGAGVERVGAGARKVAPAVGGAVASGADSAVSTVAGALDAVTISESELVVLQGRLRRANRAINQRALETRTAIADAHAGRRKQDLLDWLAVGGISLSAMAQRGVPAEVEEAFKAAYPGLASQGMGFLDAVEGKSALQLMGLVNGVKGKLFELQLVEHLNDGNLPQGLTASLAGSATQPGYDLIIADERGQVVDVLQAKATESVAYVKAALERYPDIDITTTTEVYAQLMARGVTDGLSDSGISEAVLQAKIESAARGLDDGSGLGSGSVTVALLALTTFMDKSLTLEQKGAQFGERAANVAMTGTAGKAVLAATGYWWMGLAAGVGSRALAKWGGAKRSRLESLTRMVEAAERVAARGRTQTTAMQVRRTRAQRLEAT